MQGTGDQGAGGEEAGNGGLGSGAEGSAAESGLWPGDGADCAGGIAHCVYCNFSMF